jgi:hypothetical protein
MGVSPSPPADAVPRLTAIWSQLLVVGVVDGNTDFIELGGGSLTAVRIRARIRTEFGRDVSLASLFELRTPRNVAASLASAPGWPDGES